VPGSVAQHEQEEAQQRAQQARPRPRAALAAVACLLQSPVFVRASGCKKYGQGSSAAGIHVTARVLRKRGRGRGVQGTRWARAHCGCGAAGEARAL